MALISALRAETEESSLTPDRVGYVLDQIVDWMAAQDVVVNGIKGYAVIESTDELPKHPTPKQQMIGYLMGTTLYVYVGEGGDALNGKYKSADLRGPQGYPGVNLGDVVLVNDLTTGGEGAALSAEMGKELNNRMIDDLSTYDATKYVGGSAPLSNVGYLRPDGTDGSHSDYRYTDKIDIRGCSKLKIYSKPGSSSVALVVFYDSTETYISGLVGDSPSSWENRVVCVPENAKYAVFCCFNDSYVSGFAVYRWLWTFGLQESKIAEVESQVHKEIKKYVVASDFVNTGFIRPAGTPSSLASYRYTNKIAVDGCTCLVVHDTTNNASVSPAVFYDINGNYIGGYAWASGSGNDLTIPVPSNAVYVVCSVQYSKIGDYTCKVYKYVGNLFKNDVCYLSNSGSDANDGLTASTPVKTIDRVKDLLDPKGMLYILEGDYEFNYDLSLFAFVKGIGKVRFLHYEQKIDSATLASGYTRVYSVAYTGIVSSQGKLYAKSLWQDNIPDSSTLIPTAEKHPLQFGKTYRLPSTRIYPAESVAEIEATTTKPMWYYDNNTQTLYFSIISGSSLATNPVIVPSSSSFITASKPNEVNIENVQFAYVSVKTQNLTGIFRKCSFGMTANAGALMMDYTSMLRLVNCEAYAADNDGFNTHNADTTILPMTTILFENCWGHDCGDDGESCHENCLVIHHGGLFEYNGNGVTPASNGNGEYHDVIVRNCGDHDWVTDNGGTGFSAQFSGTAHSSIVCHGCFSLNNKVGFNSSANNGSSIAANCVAKGNTIQFNNVTQINCAELT